MSNVREPYGYYVSNGYMGFVKKYNVFILFESEKEYIEYIKE